MLSLDTPTQLLDLTLIRLGQALSFFILWKIRSDYLPARDWAVGAGLASVGLVAPILLSSAEYPLLLSALVFNAFTLSGWLVFNAGVIRAAGHAVPWKTGATLSTVSVISILVLAQQAPDVIGWRIGVFHVCTIVADLYTARCALRPASGVPSRSLTIIAAGLGILVLSSFARVILSFDSRVTWGLDPLFNAQFLLVSIPLLSIAALLLTVQASEAAAQELERQARRDALTQALNRRGFDELASREWARAKRSGSSIGLLTIDVDNFKSINDSQGHHFGDQVLETICARIQSLLRPEDLLGRMGGDEFLVLLPGSSLEQTALVAERIHAAIGELVVTQDMTAMKVGLSIGVTATRASGPNQKESWDAALKAADRALYTAKNEGRNRVVVSGG